MAVSGAEKTLMINMVLIISQFATAAAQFSLVIFLVVATAAAAAVLPRNVKDEI